jgi:hypothetical protein
MRWWALLVAAVGATILAIVATTPPRPLPVNAPADVFAAERAMRDVRMIARAPHPTGSAENARVRTYLVARLRAMGFETKTVPVPLAERAREGLTMWHGHPVAAVDGVNVVAILPARDRSLPGVLLMAHHDSVWGSPGAADDTTGVAVALETARALIAAGKQQRDLIILFSDSEEIGLQGATAFFADDPWRHRVGVVINMEARGGGGRASMFETGRGNASMIRLFGEAVRRPVASSLSVFIYEQLPNSSDFTPAKQAGHPGFNFAFIGRAWQYHSPLATPEALDRGSVQDMGDQVLDLTRALLAAPSLPAPAGDRTFFDAFGLFLVSYPPALGWLFLAIAIAGYAVSMRGQRLAPAGRGIVATLAVIGLAGLLLYAGNLLSGADGPTNYYDRLAAIPRLQVQALLLGLAALTVIGALFRDDKTKPGFVAGMAFSLILLGAFVQAVAPTASYPIILPLMLGGVAAAIGGRIAAIVAAILGGGYMLGLGYFLLQAVGPDMPVVAALPLAIAAALLAPLTGTTRVRPALTASLLLIAGAAMMASWVRLDPIAPSIPLYSVDK